MTLSRRALPRVRQTRPATSGGEPIRTWPCHRPRRVSSPLRRRTTTWRRSLIRSSTTFGRRVLDRHDRCTSRSGRRRHSGCSNTGPTRSSAGRSATSFRRRIAEPSSEADFDATVASGGTWRGEGSVILPSGRELWLESTVTAVVDDGVVTGAVSVSRDMTAEYAARRGARRSRAPLPCPLGIRRGSERDPR